MGCDIHMWLEHRDHDDAPWQIQRVSPCCYCNGTGFTGHGLESNGECFSCRGKKVSELKEETEDYGSDDAPDMRTDLRGAECYDDRNYCLFLELAGVRSYTDRGPLFPPRGIPDDASSEYKRLVAQEGDDGHSHSWLDMSDVIASIICYLDPSEGVEAWEIGPQLKPFYERVVTAQMEPIAKIVGPHNVRLVFFFDN